MAKRTSPDEKPFRPLDVPVLRSVLEYQPQSSNQVVAARSSKIGEMSPSESTAPSCAVEERGLLRTSTGPSVVRCLDQEKRILLTRDETHAIDRLVNNLAVRLQTQVKSSHVLRALTALLLNAETHVDRRAGERGILVRPPNGDSTALQRFERDLAHILIDAIRDAGPLR